MKKQTLSLSDRTIQKIVDPLSTSMQVYFRVDWELRFLDYQEILWGEVRESSGYRFIPEFLEPFASILAEPFKSSVCDIMGNITLGNNLFELMFDLSYRRHGALLVSDPEHKAIKQVVNSQSIIGRESPSPYAARAMLGPVIRDIQLGRGGGETIVKKNSPGRRTSACFGKAKYSNLILEPIFE